MLLWKFFVSVASFLPWPFHRDAQRPPTQPLSGQARLIAHNAFYSTQEMRVHPSHGGISDTNFRWYGYPGRAWVPYYIDDTIDDQTRQSILDAFEHVSKKTCITFAPVTNERNYLSFTKEQGCWSYVGMLGIGAQTVSIGEGCEPFGTIVHEILHGIGFFHEHQRADRDNYLWVWEENIKEGFEGQFNKTDPPEKELRMGPLDYDSIMIYGNYAFSKDPSNLMTMAAKNEQRLYEPYDKSGMNDRDIQRVNILYRCRN